MTQILLYRCEHGIALATDSRAVVFGSTEDKPQPLVVQKLFALGPEAIAVTGGAGFGVLLCRKFQRYIMQAGLYDCEEIADTALNFFRSEAESYRRQKSFASVRSDLDRVYIIIAGRLPQGGRNPFPVLLIASEHSDDPIHLVETANILAIPRQLGIESRLAQLSPSDNILPYVESLFEGFLQRLAASDDDIGPPFHFVRIASDGITVRSL